MRRFTVGGTNLQQACLVLILVIGAALRLYGLNWDDGQWLHPDERQIYFVVLGLNWPHSLAEARSPDSPLNPQFFAYGSLPIYLLKLAAALVRPLGPALRSSDNLHLVGRPLAVLFDLGTVYLTYRLARTLFPPPCRQAGTTGRDPAHLPALLAAALVSLAVLPVQIAHFYTVDTPLTFFVMLTLNLAADVAQGGGRRHQLALGVALGLTLATKVSAAPLAFVVLSAYHARRARHKASWLYVLGQFALTLALAGIVFFLAQPYALIDWGAFRHDTIREAQIGWGTLAAPYTIQYTGTPPFLYSTWQTALWGVGLPLGVVGWVALAATLVHWLRRGHWADGLLLAWAGPYFVIGGLLYTRYLRYMLPLLPILSILAARLLADLGSFRGAGIRNPPSAIRHGVMAILVIGTWAQTLAFVSIYAEPHSWIAASAWIYREVPERSTVAVEEWDTALPLPLDLDGQSRRQTEYDVRTLPLYDEPDDAAKWEVLAVDLADSDYLIVASRRLYGSIPRLPDRYPLASRYYDLLFAGELGFELTGEFTRGPGWLNPRVPPLPGAAPTWLRPDESFVVYDHPRALIFRNVGQLSAEELLRRLGAW